MRLLSCQDLGAELFHLTLGPLSDPVARPAFQAGQFAQMAVPGHALPRPFSILNATPAGVEFLVKRVGPGTDWLCSRASGEEIPVLWPLGRGFQDLLPEQAQAEDMLLVGGGVGIAPLLAFHAQWAGRSVALFGHRDSASVAACQALMGATPALLSTEDGSQGFHGRVTALLEDFLASHGVAGKRILCCGPEAMMAAVYAVAKAHAIPCLLSLETLMGCGIGICVGCAVPLATGEKALACQGGPVFDAATLAWHGEEVQACGCGVRPCS